MTDEDKLVQGILRYGPSILEYADTTANLQLYIDRITEERLPYIQPKKANYNNWFIPEKYKELDMFQYCISLCANDVQRERVNIEHELYIKHNMVHILNVIKYIIDVLRENNVVWGVGRGSSVSSFMLYLIGVHKVDSIKYNLDINEFIR
jgi:DNA polymerase III alpha subunit